MWRSILKSFCQLMKLTFPLMVSQLGQVLIQITDSVMIGRVGSVPLAASAFASSLFSVFLVVGFAGSSAIASLVAKAHGAGRNQDCGEYLRHGLFLGTLLGLLFSVCLYLLSFNLEFFKQPLEVAIEAKDYLKWIGFSVLPLACYQAIRQYAEGLSKPSFPMFAMLVGVILNIFLNWIFIYGHLGFEALGLEGAGIATFISRFVMLILIVFLVFRSSTYKQHRPVKLFSMRFEWAKIKSLLSLAVPSGLQGLFEVGAFATATIMMGWMSAEVLAAHQIALNLAAMTFIIILSFAFAANIRVGFYVGKAEALMARREGFFIILCAASLMASFGILMSIFRFDLPEIYIKEWPVIMIASKLLIVAAVFQIFDGTQAVALGALRGWGDVKIPTAIAFISYWLVALPAAYVLGFLVKWGAYGIWIGLAIGLAFAAAALTLRFHFISSRLVSESKLR